MMLGMTLLYSLVVMIYCVRMQITYFERDKIERLDVTKNLSKYSKYYRR